MYIQKISLFNIRYRKPYYIRCIECGRILKDFDREHLCNRANREGWVYDYKNDWIYCNECKIKIMNKENCEK